MVERGHVFRRAFSWLPAQFASQNDAPVGAPRQFGSTEHLSIEAIAAFVDGELRMNVVSARGASHLAVPGMCRGSRGSPSRPRGAARLQPDQSPEHAVGIAVADSALPARRRCGCSAGRPVGDSPRTGKRWPTTGRRQAVEAVRSTCRRQHTRSPRASVGWIPVWPSRCAAPCSSP